MPSPSVRLAAERPGSLPATVRWTLLRTVLREAVSAAPPRAGFRLLRSVSQHTQRLTLRLARGCCAPLQIPRHTAPLP